MVIGRHLYIHRLFLNRSSSVQIHVLSTYVHVHIHERITKMSAIFDDMYALYGLNIPPCVLVFDGHLRSYLCVFVCLDPFFVVCH